VCRALDIGDRDRGHFRTANPPSYGYVRMLSRRRRAGISLGAVCCCTLCTMWSPSRVCEDLARLRVPADGGQRERFTGICGRRGNPINVGVELGVRRTPSDRRTNQTARTVSHRGRQRRRPIVGRPSSDYGCLDAGQWPSIVSPTAASSYPEVCLCALR
jgi:hypothetical protein